MLLACYNGAEWIAEQVSTVLGQVDVAVDLVVSDDGSSDDSISVLEHWSTDERVTVMSAESPTGSAAQNFFRLIRNAGADRHDYVAFSDQDDVWATHKLSRACEMLHAGGAAGYSCAVVAYWENGRAAVLRQNSRLTASDFLFEGAGQGCTYVLTAEF